MLFSLFPLRICWYIFVFLLKKPGDLFALANKLLMCLSNLYTWPFEYEDTKGAIEIRKSKKNRQHNGKRKKDKRTNSDLQNTTQKIKDRSPLKNGSLGVGELMLNCIVKTPQIKFVFYFISSNSILLYIFWCRNITNVSIMEKCKVRQYVTYNVGQ